jgi:hypothetical protein
MTNEELFEQEEKCIKSIRTVRKAVFMRIFVTGLLIWAVIVGQMDFWVVGLMALVLLINIVGTLPLINEWKKQKSLLKELIAQEE